MCSELFEAWIMQEGYICLIEFDTLSYVDFTIWGKRLVSFMTKAVSYEDTSLCENLAYDDNRV